MTHYRSIHTADMSATMTASSVALALRHAVVIYIVQPPAFPVDRLLQLGGVVPFQEFCSPAGDLRPNERRHV